MYKRQLLISARHGSRLGDGTLTGTDIVLFDQTVGISANLFAFQKAQFIGKLWFEISLKDDVVSVSYTHLDVYKRQAL